MATDTGTDIPQHNRVKQDSHILRLPSEITSHIISHLPASTLAPLSATCFQLYHLVHTDAHWRQRVLDYDIGHASSSPAPYKKWEDLFLGHYPYWFLPKHRIWFADGTETDGGLAGQMIICHYDQRTGYIMGYALVGEKGTSGTHIWPEKSNVNIHDFHPRIRLHLENPVIRLRPRPGVLPRAYDKRDQREPKGLASSRSAQNDLNEAHRIESHVMLARAIPPDRQHESMRLWPPSRLPAIDRVRQFTPSLWSQMQLSRPDAPGEINGTSYERPTAHADICESAFRLRRKLGGHPARLFELLAGGLDARRSGGVATYSTLPEDAYRPTKERPYQGIWVGDYAGHGCEFLLIRQKITKPEIQASEPVQPRLDNLFNAQNPIIQDEWDQDAETEDNHAEGHLDTDSHFTPSHSDAEHEPGTMPDAKDIGETGRLEAIKLTGDVNVPRGEFTFVAEDIGKAGEVFVASSAEFAGKRVVKSWGHIAARGFIDDVFVKADLILVSHDCLAQHWAEFGHVAFYRRVDVDWFFDQQGSQRVLQL